MYDAGYMNITSIDISEVVVERMNAQASKKGKVDLVYHVMDATQTPYVDEQFDFVVDKGTLDALACGQVSEISSKLMIEMLRITKHGLIIVSHSPSTARKVLKYPHHIGSFFEMFTIRSNSYP